MAVLSYFQWPNFPQIGQSQQEDGADGGEEEEDSDEDDDDDDDDDDDEDEDDSEEQEEDQGSQERPYSFREKRPTTRRYIAPPISGMCELILDSSFRICRYVFH